MNPFQLVFNALWEMLEARAELTDIVRPGNRIKYNVETDRSPLKEHVQTADLPELILVTSGSGVSNTHATSSSSSITRQYAWLISTGDFRLVHKLYPVQWAIFCAMHDWQTRLAGLQWQGKPFVKKCDTLDISEGESDAERNRGIRGWSSVMRLEVEMFFLSSDLRA